MCGRYTLIADYEELAEEFGLREAHVLVPRRFNIAPTQSALVVRAREGGERELAEMRWGLVPSWAKDPAIGNRMINARSEGAAGKPAFRAAMKRRRCLVPASGFYEWTAHPIEPGAANAAPQRGARARGGGKTAKTPYLIRRPDARLLGLAGLWEQWQGPEGALESFTILTTEASASVAPLHDRMPVIVPSAAYERWLDPATQDASRVAGLLRPWPERLAMQQVSPRLNNPRLDDAACMQPPTQE